MTKRLSPTLWAFALTLLSTALLGLGVAETLLPATVGDMCGAPGAFCGSAGMKPCCMGSSCIGGICRMTSGLPVQQAPSITPKPAPSDECACITLYDPVCGKDGKTYSNSCYLACAEVELNHPGECSAPPPPPPPPPPADECVCATVYDPVCGTDGNTYENDCRLRCAGVELDHRGTCLCNCTTEYKPVCDPSTGFTYSNACVAVRCNGVKKYEVGQCVKAVDSQQSDTPLPPCLQGLCSQQFNGSAWMQATIDCPAGSMLDPNAPACGTTQRQGKCQSCLPTAARIPTTPSPAQPGSQIANPPPIPALTAPPTSLFNSNTPTAPVPVTAPPTARSSLGGVVDTVIDWLFGTPQGSNPGA